MNIWQRAIRSGTLWIILCYLLLMPAFFRPVLHGVDPVGYFSWLRSAVVDGDLDVANEFETLGIYRDYDYQNITLSTGYRYNQWSPGPALLWSPFYAPFHGMLNGLNAARLGLPSSGYDAPYIFVVSLGTTLYVVLGMLLLHRVARAYTSDLLAALGVITVWAASPLLFYTFSSPLMSHAHDFFACALFVWVWQRTRPGRDAGGWFWRGVVIGLSIFIRIQNVLLVVLPAIALLWGSFRAAQPIAQRTRLLLGNGLAFGAGAMVFLVPLMIFWKIVYGAWIYNSYAITNQLDNIQIDWLQPRLLSLAFSNDHGLFFWSPALLLALAGVLLLLRIDQEFGLLLIGIIAVQFYFISTLTTWNGGGPSFGARMLIGTLPAFVIGMAISLHALHARLRLRYLAAMCGLFTIWNFLLVVQYALGTIPRTGQIDPVDLWWSQLRVVPENAERIMNILRTRGD